MDNCGSGDLCFSLGEIPGFHSLVTRRDGSDDLGLDSRMSPLASARDEGSVPVNAVVLVAEEAANTIPGQPWMYGAFALAALLTALFLVTRLNKNR